MSLNFPLVIRSVGTFVSCFKRSLKLEESLSYSITMFVCVYVCMLPISSETAGLIWLNFFLLAHAWSQGGFRLKKLRIRDPLFPEIRKKSGFRVLFYQFDGNFQDLIILTQNMY